MISRLAENASSSDIAAIYVIAAIAGSMYLLLVVKIGKVVGPVPRAVVKAVVTYGQLRYRSWGPQSIWDPSTGRYLHVTGSVEYVRDGDDVVLTITDRAGHVLNRRGPIPPELRPLSPEQIRAGRMLAWLHLAYAVVLLGAFAVGVGLSSGSGDRRAGIGGLVAVLAVGVTWTVVHLAVVRPHLPHHRRRPPRHLLPWVGLFVAVTGALGVEQKISALQAEHTRSWGDSFIGGALLAAAIVGAAYAMFHHSDHTHGHLP